MYQCQPLIFPPPSTPHICHEGYTRSQRSPIKTAKSMSCFQSQVILRLKQEFEVKLPGKVQIYKIKHFVKSCKTIFKNTAYKTIKPVTVFAPHFCTLDAVPSLTH